MWLVVIAVMITVLIRLTYYSLNLFDKMNVISVQKQLNVSVDKSVNFDKNKPSSSDTLGLLGVSVTHNDDYWLVAGCVVWVSICFIISAIWASVAAWVSATAFLASASSSSSTVKINALLGSITGGAPVSP